MINLVSESFNTADNYGTPASAYNSDNNIKNGSCGAYTGILNDFYNTGGNLGNGGDGGGTDMLGDVTVINTAVGYNPTFAADNVYNGTGSIGLYGRSRGVSFSIGVMGQSSKGCAIYGLATDENPSTTDPSHGIGVVGRSMNGDATEPTSVEELMAVSSGIGVLGQSATGLGVRGHGGPLPIPIPEGGTLPSPVGNAQPGGWFSSGQIIPGQLLPDQNAPSPPSQEISLDTSPQLRLTPSATNALPRTAMIGDFSSRLVPPGNMHYAFLYICTGYNSKTNQPVWQQVQFVPN